MRVKENIAAQPSTQFPDDRRGSRNDWSEQIWERERPRRFWDPSRKLLQSLRNYQRLESATVLQNFRRGLCVVRHRFWSVLAGSDIPLNCQIVGGLLLPHPNGIVIHPKSVIGPNCLLFQQVTLVGQVILGCHVDVGAAAKLLRPIEVGDHVRVGANAVVTMNFPAGVTVVGVLAREI